MCGGATICKAFIGRAEFYGGLYLHFPWGVGCYVSYILNSQLSHNNLTLISWMEEHLIIEHAKI